MTYSIIWEPGPVNAASSYLKDDPAGLQNVFAAVDRLMVDAKPDSAVAYGSPDRLRLRIGSYSVVYEVHDDTGTIAVLYLGRR